MKNFILAMVFGGAVVGSALAQPPAPEPAAVPASPGQALFSARCQGCHNDFVNNAPTLFTLSTYKPEVIVTALKTGKMQPMAMGLSDDELSLIATYIIKTKPAV